MESAINQGNVDYCGKPDKEMDMDIDLNNNLDFDPAVPVISEVISTAKAAPLFEKGISMIEPKVKGLDRDRDYSIKKKEKKLFVPRSKGISKVGRETSKVIRSSSKSASKPKKSQLDILRIIDTYEKFGETWSGLNFVDFFNAGVSVPLDWNFNLEEELSKTLKAGVFDWIQDAAEIDKKNQYIRRRIEILNARW